MMKKRADKSAEFLDVRIERIVPDGFGIAFTENLTVFVSLVAAGDLVRVKINRRKGKIAFAELIEVLEPSPNRILPPCPYFGRCGGCDFQQMNYETQLLAKLGIIKDCLRRIGRIEWQMPIEITASPNEWNYRTRVQWKRENDRIGYFERNSHRVADVAECPILVASLQETLQAIRGRSVDFVEAHAVAGDDGVSMRFEKRATAEDFEGNFYAANKEQAVKSRNDNNNSSEINLPKVNLTVGDFRYRFNAATFFQVNHRLLPEFVRAAIGESGGDFALDLYCGAGLFTLPLAANFRRVSGIEGNAESINFAEENAADAKIENVRFEIASVGDWLIKNATDLPKVDFVLLDPPRSGAERETIETLIKLKPAQIVYVSCNPATLARDLKMMIETGDYKIENVRAFDFFPQTHHVETIVRLTL